MNNIKIFRSAYADQLRREIEKGVDLNRYAKESFPVDESMLDELIGIERLDTLVNKMSPKQEDDIVSAKVLYEALGMLNLAQASYKPFWESLSHIDLFPYVQKPWPKVTERGFGEKNYVLDHWFVTKRPMRHSLAGLWWAVNQTIDNSNTTNPYYLTEYLFKHVDFRTRRLGSSTLFRYKPAVQGILQFMHECDELNDTYFEGRANYIIMYFNQMGAVRQLASLPKEFFYNELNRKKDDILKVQYRDEVAEALLDLDDE